MTNGNLLDMSTDDPIQVDPNKNYLEEYVGEGKKFKTVEDLAKGKYMSDTYIPILEKNLDEMKSDYLKLRDESVAGATLQEKIDKLLELQQLTSNKQPQVNEVKEQSPFDPKQVESLVSSQIQKHDLLKKEETNYSVVMGKLQEKLGTQYKSILKTQAVNLGLTDDMVNAMARTNPKLFFKTFDLDQPKQTENFQSPPTSNKRSTDFSPSTGEKRTWAWYMGEKKKNPNLLLDKNIRIQMDKDAQELGLKEFFGT